MKIHFSIARFEWNEPPQEPSSALLRGTYAKDTSVSYRNFSDVGQLPIVSRARWADYSQRQSQCTPLDQDLSRRIKIT